MVQGKAYEVAALKPANQVVSGKTAALRGHRNFLKYRLDD
jgi:hypothetical protein